MAATLILAAAVLVSPDRLPEMDICWMRALLGIPCPGCGLTHAFCAIGHGRFTEAWAFNPFSFLFFILAMGWALSPFWVHRQGSHPAGTGVVWPIVLVAAMYIGWILRLA